MLMFACSKITETPSDYESKLGIESAELRTGIGIAYTMCWDEWGRKKYDCARWGLCDYNGCWHWTWNEPDCCPGAVNMGLLGYDDNLEDYFFTISLSTQDSLAVQAANEQRPIIFDEQLIITDTLDSSIFTMTIDSGEYIYNSNAGTSIIGGYIIPVQVFIDSL